jgi:hypothetical protein
LIKDNAPIPEKKSIENKILIGFIVSFSRSKANFWREKQIKKPETFGSGF